MINNYLIDYSIANNLGMEILKQYNIFPIKKEELHILVATSDISQDKTILTTLLKSPIKFIEVSPKILQQQFQYFPTQYEIYSLSRKVFYHNAQYNSENSSIVTMIEKIITFAISLNASDIHIETSTTNVVIRFRIDGILYIFFTFELYFSAIFSSILKLFANLDISKTRLPQNGRFSKEFKIQQSTSFDFRLSTMPTINGESLVLRILYNTNAQIKLNEIGFDNDTFRILNQLIFSHQGMILVTGPTGSGKTTTLYSILNSLNTPEKKIITIEDPIEYNLNGIQQINVNEDINFDYSIILKNILRQDPDIIMIGEIRDEKVLKTAIQASLTGHLVLATLHTNNAPDTINRLLDLNTPPYLIATTIKAIVSQRLVRKLCPYCKSKSNQPIGCNKCNLSGYKNRIIISEILQFDETISELISKNTPLTQIIKYAKSKGYKTLKEHIFEQINRGLTSIDEYYTKVQL